MRIGFLCSLMEKLSLMSAGEDGLRADLAVLVEKHKPLLREICSVTLGEPARDGKVVLPSSESTSHKPGK